MPRVPPYSYTDENNELYPLFRTRLKAKLEIDGPAIGPERSRVFYGFFCLAGKAATTIRPWIDAYCDHEEVFTVENFFPNS